MSVVMGAASEYSEVAGFMMIVGFGGGVLVNVALGAAVSGLRVLMRMAGGG